MGLNESNLSVAGLLDRGTYYGTPLTGRVAGDLTLSESRYASGVQIPPHAHRDPYFCLVLEGWFEEICGARRETCGPGTLVFHLANEVHADRFGPQGGRCFNLALAPRLVERLAEEGTLPHARITVGPGLAAAMAARLRATHGRSSVEIEEAVLALMGAFAPPSPPPTWRGRRPAWLEHGMERLRERACPSIASLAEEAGVHPVHFTRAFRAAFQRTPGAVARHARLERAAAELLRCDAPVAAIAHRAGFADHSHFCRHFRRAFGMTPSEYRGLFDDQY